jgi:hypothetical protein
MRASFATVTNALVSASITCFVLATLTVPAQRIMADQHQPCDYNTYSTTGCPDGYECVGGYCFPVASAPCGGDVGGAGTCNTNCVETVSKPL